MTALGGVYLIAFTSLRAQVKGLYGERGIRPVRTYLDAVRTHIPASRERWRRVPTIFWLDASDASLVRACRAGQVGSVLMMLGVAPRLVGVGLWGLYLSFVSVGREFLSYQWDVLLLENGLHAVAIAPASPRERPPWTAVALMRWLAFRLQLESGHAKLASRDRTWRNGDAMTYHFATQPLPTKLGWGAHQLPRPLKHAMTYGTLVVELGAPWLAFAPRTLRKLAFAALSGLQVMIAATGNYGFFNLLTIADNVWLLDDRTIAGPLARVVRGTRPSAWRRLVSAASTASLIALSAALLVPRLFRRARVPESLDRAHDAIAPLRSVNAYGLFAVMTTDRPEIAIEGSDDAVIWRPYEFRYKPGDMQRAPRLVAPHMPRLDWQMWFAAMRPAPPWFMKFLQRLLEGSPDVLALLATNPFPDRPPRYVRALLYDYKMTDRATRDATGAYWKRELLGTYVPPAELAT